MANLTEEKKKATRLLTKWVGQIALEESEVQQDTPTDAPRMITKAEALSRLMWKMALGYTETVQDKVGGTLVENTIVHVPNAGMIALLYDRMEGRVPLAAEPEHAGRTVSEKVTEQSRNRINASGKIKDAAGKSKGSDKAKSA
jgi:hypothetical protein